MKNDQDPATARRRNEIFFKALNVAALRRCVFSSAGNADVTVSIPISLLHRDRTLNGALRSHDIHWAGWVNLRRMLTLMVSIPTFIVGTFQRYNI